MLLHYIKVNSDISPLPSYYLLVRGIWQLGCAL